MINLKWCFVAKTFSWPLVEFVKLLLDISIGNIRQVFAFREIFPQQSVGVLIRAALPRMMGQGKIEFHLLQRSRDFRMFRKFLSAVRRNGMQRFVAQCLDHDRVDGIRFLGFGFPSNQIAAFSVHQCYEARLSRDAGYGVAFPMTQAGTVGCAGRALADVIADLDFPTPFFIRLGVPRLAPVPELADNTPASMRALPHVKHAAVNSTVNRCVADDASLVLQCQPTGNLLGRPLVLQELFLDRLEKGWIIEAFAWATGFSPLGIHLLGFDGKIQFSVAVPPEFTGYGGLVPFQFFRDLSDGISLCRKIE